MSTLCLLHPHYMNRCLYACIPYGAVVSLNTQFQRMLYGDLSTTVSKGRAYQKSRLHGICWSFIVISMCVYTYVYITFCTCLPFCLQLQNGVSQTDAIAIGQQAYFSFTVNNPGMDVSIILTTLSGTADKHVRLLLSIFDGDVIE